MPEAGNAPAAEAPPAPTPSKSAKARPLLTVIAFGMILRVLPRPAAVSGRGWSMAALFAATILAIALQPMPTGAIAVTSLSIGLVTGTVTFSEGMSGFSNEVIWLVVVAFFLAKAFDRTRLARRIALLFVLGFGKTALGLAYGIALAEVVLGLAIPSSAARAAGILFPLVMAMAEEAGEEAALGPFLLLSTFQVTAHSGALWITSAATNFLSVSLGQGLGVVLENEFADWLRGSAGPALVGIVVSPVVALLLAPPKRRKTPDLPGVAKQKLADMGEMSRDERVLLAIIVGMVLLWSLASSVVRPITTALLGLSALLITGVLEWKDCVEHKQVWDTFVWFALLVGLSSSLNSLGVIQWMSTTVGASIAGIGMSWHGTLLLISFAYMYSHYLFASQVAHISALFQPAGGILIAAGCPPKLAVLLLAYIGNIFATMTSYSAAHAPVFFSAKFFTSGEWWRINFIFSVVNLGIWLGVGFIWWPLVGLTDGAVEGGEAVVAS